MAATAFLIAAALLGHARAGVVELSCSDNATCIENMAKEFVRSVRQQKTVRLFDVLTIEPLSTRQARSNEGLLSRLLSNNAFSFDWKDYTFRLWKAQDRSDALDFEVFQGRSAKDVSEEVPKKSKSKVEEEDEEEVEKKKKPAPKGGKGIIRRRAKRKIMQAVIPMVFGMKSSAALIFAMFLVTVLTLKAFVLSKVALVVTVGMALKRLYESYSMGVGLQNHPYLYSQYPIDFPSASSHAYSVSGMSPQFPEMYNPTAMASQQQDISPQHDASAQQSQQAPTVQLLNSTRASERWDGKSKLEKLLQPLLNGIRSYIDPIANVFYAMPATFRGLSSDVSTMKTNEEEVKKPREILVAQPRLIAQRKMNFRKTIRNRPKKYTELKIDLNKLKNNKDLYDYLKTKKYKFNYHNTYYYPRVKYFVNPNTFFVRPKTTRLEPYRKEISSNVSISKPNVTLVNLQDRRPAILVPVMTNQTNLTNFILNITNMSSKNPYVNVEPSRHTRVKRSLHENSINNIEGNEEDKQLKNIFNIPGRSMLDLFSSLSSKDHLSGILKHANQYTKKFLKSSLKSASPPYYYSITYDIIMMTLDVIDGMIEVHSDLVEHFFGSPRESHHQKAKKKKKKKHQQHHQHHQQLQQTQIQNQQQQLQNQQQQLQNQEQEQLESSKKNKKKL